ncbi:signal-regulatory protein beta-1-like isoform X2 [Lepisosteus oculatus]|uniref:signal-regulatory protein beta-1-like isoform X2 n=1 Tax=Lepisosteus oculatus TaxID=7918 RepID=UPI003718ACE2
MGPASEAMKLIWCVFLVLPGLSRGVSPEVTVSQPQSSVTGDAGDSVTLNCTRSHLALGPTKWSRGTGPQKQQLDIKPAETPGHISWASGNHPTEKSIVISELSLRDSGVYYCEWYRPSQNQPSASGSGTTLTVRGKPIITPPAGRASPGDRVTLSCESEGAGNTPLSWDRDGQSQTGVQERHLTDRSRSSLTLTAAPSFIISTVRCLIPPATGKDTPVSTALQLRDFITVPPAVKVTGQTQLVLGQSASLTCQLSGFYPASWTLQWLLNDKTLGPQAGTQISRTEPQPSEEGTFTQSSLVQLTGSLELRAAALVCQAEFEGKHSERDSITLRVRGSPHITAPEKRVKAGDDLTLNCESVGDTDTPLSWRVGMKNMSGEQSRLPSSSFQGTSSSLTLRADKSFIRETVFCEIPETDLSASLRLEPVITVVPTVKIKSPEEMFLNQTVNISCLVSGFFPHSVSVSWEPMTLSRTPVQDQNCTKIQNQDGTYSAELWAWFLFKAELNGFFLLPVPHWSGPQGAGAPVCDSGSDLSPCPSAPTHLSNCSCSSQKC